MAIKYLSKGSGDNSWELIERIWGSPVKKKDLPADYVDAIEYVVNEFTKTYGDTLLLRRRFGIGDSYRTSSAKLAEAEGCSKTTIDNRIKKIIWDFRENGRIVFILKFGLEAYKKRDGDIKLLKQRLSTGDLGFRMADLFMYMRIWEVDMPVKCHNALVNHFLQTKELEKIGLLDFMLLSRSELEQVNGLEDNIDYLVELQGKLLKSNGWTGKLEDWQGWIGDMYWHARAVSKAAEPAETVEE